jgi:large conductance mechanosensitive channel
MSTSPTNEGDATVIKTKVTVEQTEVATGKTKIDDILMKDITKVGKGALKSLGGFRTFILRGNVVDLAIGIVIGAAFTSVVTALVGDIITPLIPLPGKNSLGSLNILLPSPPYPKNSAIQIGLFINAVISFLVVAAVLYFLVVQPVNALMKLYKPKETEIHETRDCPYCYQTVNIKATRCPYCTSQLNESDGQIKEKETVLMLPESLERLSEQLAEKIVRKATFQFERTAEESGTEVTKTE